MFTQCYLRRMRVAFSLLLLAGLTSISSVARAASAGFPFVSTDLSGTRTSVVTVAIGGVTLTVGAPTTVTGFPLAGGSGVTCSVTLANPGSGALYTLNYDAAATGDMYFPLVITKAGSTFAAITDAICSTDASNSATAATQSAAVNTKLGSPVGASVSADIAAIPTANTIANVVWAATMDGSITSKAALVALIANILGTGTNTYNATTRVLTTAKKKQDGVTTAYTVNTTLNAGAAAPNPASATVTPGTLP
jgi:hypothetical protein